MTVCSSPLRRLHKTLLGSGLVAFGLLIFTLSAYSDETSEPIAGVTVEAAVASPAPAGATSEIRFRIVNSGVLDIAVTGIRANAAGSGALVLEDPLTGPRDVPILTILREEELDLTTSHILGELRDLKKDLIEGELITFELIFREGTVSAVADIHDR